MCVWAYSLNSSKDCDCILMLLVCFSDSSIIQLERLEYHVREELNKTAPRTMVVLNPLKVCVILFVSLAFWGQLSVLQSLFLHIRLL